MSTQAQEVAEASRTQERESPRIDAASVMDRTGNDSFNAATDRRMQYACGGGGDRNLSLNDIARPQLSENGLTPGQRSEAISEAERVSSAVKGLGDVNRATPEQQRQLNNVLDNPNTPFSVKLDYMPQHQNPNAPRHRCPTPPASVTFPPPAMEGNYKMIDGNLHIINSRGGYTPFESVIDRLRTGPRARI